MLSRAAQTGSELNAIRRRAPGEGSKELDSDPNNPRKGGPILMLQRHIERISTIPKPRKRAAIDLIVAMLHQQTR
jgi:hypothetical protein